MRRAWTTCLTLALCACSGADATTDAGASVDAASVVDGAAADAALVDAASGPDAGPWPVLHACELKAFGGGEHELLEGRSTDRRVSYRLWRCVVMQGAGFTGIYRADAFELVVDGVTRRVTTDAIEYDSTHHNWSDSLVATDAAGTLHWRVEFQMSGELWHYVHTEDSAGATVLPETRVDD